ncbi:MULTISPECIES: hypothetical protein [Pseudomonas]|uniref:Uncharacterized protein n=1 Tax=Pseudomonas fluorescens (strain Pf0-1) TaxID=205922 RepID=Q3KJU5_PSEPF|nr:MULTISPECIES: hypothetical protein [Pseudomonas]ABA71961.1 hypothetical protein Pfl01_0217 [Pseudomonas fluorescens Pf0-1]MBL0795898.1 hypothetical protein [Pseudomonas sp. B7]MBY9023445.1 hypothetical protein [Pseudomonas fluorescens]MBY9029437.1 hypothetical protein [Pseudomonas fluorescens]MBY9035555.1 hypothetical protein [Pseudomonas fluorescens]
MKLNNFVIALALLSSTLLHAAEESKSADFKTDFKNASQALTLIAKIYGHPDTNLLPGENISIPFLPVAGAIINASASGKIQHISISRVGCPQELCVVLSDSKKSNSSLNKTAAQRRITPDFEIINKGTSNITARKVDDLSWVTIPPGGSAKIGNINDSGFHIDGYMKIIQIDKQKCTLEHCFWVLE